MHKNGLCHAPTSTCVADVLLRCEALSPTPLLSVSVSLSFVLSFTHAANWLPCSCSAVITTFFFVVQSVSQSAHAVVDFMISSKSKLIPEVEIRI
jgi:hypothetical protein